MSELREFVCKECGHTVVVHPDYPPDQAPSVCRECWGAVGPLLSAKSILLLDQVEEFINRLTEDRP